MIVRPVCFGESREDGVDDDPKAIPAGEEEPFSEPFSGPFSGPFSEVRGTLFPCIATDQ